MSKPQAEQGSMTKQVIIAGVAALEMNIVRLRYAVPVLLLGVAACGGSPAASKAAASTAPPVALHGVFIRYYGANPASDGWDRALTLRPTRARRYQRKLTARRGLLT